MIVELQLSLNWHLFVHPKCPSLILKEIRAWYVCNRFELRDRQANGSLDISSSSFIRFSFSLSCLKSPNVSCFSEFLKFYLVLHKKIMNPTKLTATTYIRQIKTIFLKFHPTKCIWDWTILRTTQDCNCRLRTNGETRVTTSLWEMNPARCTVGGGRRSVASVLGAGLSRSPQGTRAYYQAVLSRTASSSGSAACPPSVPRPVACRPTRHIYPPSRAS